MYFQVRNNQNMSEKYQKFEKNSAQKCDDILLKNFGKMHKFWSLETWSRSFWWSVVLGVFDEVLVSVSKITVSTTSLVITAKY